MENLENIIDENHDVPGVMRDNVDILSINEIHSEDLSTNTSDTTEKANDVALLDDTQTNSKDQSTTDDFEIQCNEMNQTLEKDDGIINEITNNEKMNISSIINSLEDSELKNKTEICEDSDKISHEVQNTTIKVNNQDLANNIIKTSTLRDLPTIYFHIISKRLKERLKVCSTLGLFVDDIADVENISGQKFIKAGSSIMTFSKPELFDNNINSSNTGESSSLLSTIDNIFKQHTIQLGKLHISSFDNLNQNIGKVFPEYSNEIKKKIKYLTTKVSAEFEDFKKIRLSYNKKYEKYIKLGNELTEAIRLRDEFLNNAGTIEKQSNSNTISNDPMNMRFMNRLFSTKSNNNNLNEKKIVDRCRELFTLFQENEKALLNSHNKLTSISQNIDGLVKKVISEYTYIEESREKNMKEGLRRFLMVFESLLQRNSELLSLLLGEVNSADIISEVKVFSDIDSYINIISMPSSTNTDVQNVISTLSALCDRNIEAIDAWRGRIQYIKQYLSDFCDIYRQLSKSMHKTLDKHGFLSLSPSIPRENKKNSINVIPPSLSLGLAANMVQASNDKVFGIVLASYESPYMKLSWEIASKVVYEISVTHLSNFIEEVVQTALSPIDTILRQLDAIRKDLVEKQALHIKRINSQKSNVLKASTKLSKIQKDLDDKRGALLSEASSSDNNIRGNSDVLGLNLRNTELASFERKQKLENKIENLLEDEVSLASQLNSSTSDLNEVFVAAKTEFTELLQSSKLAFANSLGQLKELLGNYLVLQLHYIATSNRSLLDIKHTTDSIEVEKDMEYFVELLRKSIIIQDGYYSYSSSDDSNLDMVNLSGSPFIPFSSPAIEEEREALGGHLRIDPSNEEERLSSNSHVTEDSAELLRASSGSSRSSIDFSDDKSTGLVPFLESDETNISDSVATEKVAIDEPNDEDQDIIDADLSKTPSKKSKFQTAIEELNNDKSPQGVTIETPQKQNKVTVPNNVRDESNELLKFGLSMSDRVIDSHSCALYPKKGMLTHGRMYITQHFIAFSGWPDTRVLLSMEHIVKVEKMNTLMYVPNALQITTKDTEEYFFGSFIDRDQCFNLIVQMSDVGKRLLELHGPNPAIEEKGLVFGFQSNYTAAAISAISASVASATQFNPSVNDPNIPPILSNVVASGVTPSKVDSNMITSFYSQAMKSFLPSDVSSAVASNLIQNSNLAPLEVEMERLENVSQNNISADSQSPISMPSIAKSTPNDNKSISSLGLTSDFLPIAKIEGPFNGYDDIDDGINVSSLFKKFNITTVGEHVYKDVSVSDFWKLFWLNISGFRGFMESEGDFDLKCSEWRKLDKLPSEDVMKLPFSYTRDLSFLHPRTTMLMFGPKNAPGKQKHFLYLPHGKGQTDGILNEVNPRRGVILVFTELEGIPMADVFRVLQYWTFETKVDTPSTMHVQVGFAVHFLKSSMFKGQILSGVKDEMIPSIENWNKYICKQLQSIPFRDVSSVSPSIRHSATIESPMIVQPSSKDIPRIGDSMKTISPEIETRDAKAFDTLTQSTGFSVFGLFIISRRYVILAFIVLVSYVIWLQRRETELEIGMKNLTSQFNELLAIHKSQEERYQLLSSTMIELKYGIETCNNHVSMLIQTRLKSSSEE